LKGKIMSIREKAMLVSLSISYWTGKANDDRVLDDLTAKHKTDRDVHEYRKVLIKPEAINAVKAARSRARAYYFEKTLPWIDGGTRILPSAFYFEYAKKMHEFKGEYEKAVADFITRYTGLKGEARKRLGDLFRDEDYPAVESLRRKFGFEDRVFPIPGKDDFRVDLGGKAEADIKRQIEESVRAATEVATRDLWKRLYHTVEALATRMKDADPTFRDSIIGNIRDICTVMGDMNVTGDKDLTAMTKKVLEELTKIGPQELRDEPKARKKVADSADAILAKMAGYIGGK
jgi:hypothetical protein